MGPEVIQFIRKYTKEIQDENAAIFAGAGLSIPAGFVNWKDLLRPIADELELDVEREHDLVTLAQFHLNKNANNRSELNRILLEEFSGQGKITENHRILSRLPISAFWTTNYDKLIERSLEEAGRVVDVKYTVPQLAQTKPKRDCVVYKMHGDIDHPHEAILSRDDYESYHVKFQPFINALSGDLVEKTFLFIGFSFTDPNLDHVLSRIRITYGTNQRRHYCLLKKIERLDDEGDDDFEYRQRRQAFFVEDLKRVNIQAIELDTYEQVTEILRQIDKAHKQKTILISGAAHDYGPWGREKSEAFVSELSNRLVGSGYKIVTGMGLGIGSAVISGALTHIYMKDKKTLRDEIIMRPFPQSISNLDDQSAVWEAYRQDMSDYAGVSVFMFGNKLTDNGVVSSNGVIREFEIAVEKGHFVMPIGATGYVAKELWDRVMDQFDTYYPNGDDKLKTEFEKLGNNDASPEDLVSTSIKILKGIV